MTPPNHQELLGLTAEIVASHVSRNAVAAADLSLLIERVYGSLARAGTPEAPPEARPQPAVPVRASIKPDYLVCLEDGKKLKLLRPYLANRHNMTPDEYRSKWGLAPDYPMVAPNYTVRRSELARQMGLGSRRTEQPAEAGSRRKLGIAVPKD